MRESLLDNYLNKKITNSFINEKMVKILFDDGEHLELYAQGYCCSDSWFESPSGEEALNPGVTLLEINLIDLDKVIEKEDKYDYTEEIIQFYSIKIKTTGGYCDIEMRNSSNGYYGGYLSLNKNDQYGNSIYFESNK